MPASPAPLRLAVAFELGDEAQVRALLAEDPGLMRSLAEEDRPRITDAAQDNRTDAVRLMLATGWPVDARGQHGGTPLHWAAWHGNVEMVRDVMRHDPPLEAKDDDFGGTPLTWAAHASVHGWHPERGDYAGTVKALLEAGAAVPAELEGSEAVRAVLTRRLGTV